MSEKPHLNIVMAGHVDHGKSTIMGHFLYLLGVVDKRLIDEYARESEKMGAGDTFKFAWVLDRLKEERERGVTIDLAYDKFFTDKYYYTLIDAPGHRDFVKNMITGASQADVAILVVSVKKGEFEVGIAPGGQAREHAFLLKTLGVNQIVVLLNKFDDPLVEWSPTIYKTCKAEVEKLLKTLGFKLEKIPIIPVSGWTGDNLIKLSERMRWYKGPTLYEALDLMEVPSKPIDKPLRIPVQDVYTITGVGTVPVGRVETGVLKEGDVVMIAPSMKKCEVRSIEMHHKRIPKAEPGDNIGMNLKGVAREEVRRGYVIANPEAPPPVAREFIAQIVVIYHPTTISAGYTPVLHVHTATVATRIKEIMAKLDPRTGQVVEEHPKSLKTGDAAIVRMEPLKPLVIEPHSKVPQLGRFALRDMGMTIAAGIVKEITATH